MRKKIWSILFIFVMLVSACGGDGGGSKSEADEDVDGLIVITGCNEEGDQKVVFCEDESGFQKMVCDGKKWQLEGDCVIFKGSDASCIDGETKVVECTEDETMIQKMECAEKKWTKKGECIDPKADPIVAHDDCTDDETAVVDCGYEGEEQAMKCVEGKWMPEGDCAMAPCENGDVKEIRCGWDFTGRMRKACEEGIWQAETHCYYGREEGDQIKMIVHRNADGTIKYVDKYEYHSNGTISRRMKVLGDHNGRVLASDSYLPNGQKFKTFNGNAETEWLVAGDVVYRNNTVKITSFQAGVIIGLRTYSYDENMLMENQTVKSWDASGNLTSHMIENYIPDGCDVFKKSYKTFNGDGNLIEEKSYNDSKQLVKWFRAGGYVGSSVTWNDRNRYTSIEIPATKIYSSYRYWVKNIYWVEYEYDTEGLLLKITTKDREGRNVEEFTYSSGNGLHLITKHSRFDKGELIVENEYTLYKGKGCSKDSQCDGNFDEECVFVSNQYRGANYSSGQCRRPVKHLCERAVPSFGGFDKCPKWVFVEDVDNGDHFVCEYPETYPTCKTNYTDFEEAIPGENQVAKTNLDGSMTYYFCSSFYECEEDDLCKCKTDGVNSTHCLEEWTRDGEGNETSYKKTVNESGADKVIRERKYNSANLITEETCEYQNCFCWRDYGNFKDMTNNCVPNRNSSSTTHTATSKAKKTWTYDRGFVKTFIVEDEDRNNTVFDTTCDVTPPTGSKVTEHVCTWDYFTNRCNETLSWAAAASTTLTISVPNIRQRTTFTYNQSANDNGEQKTESIFTINMVKNVTRVATDDDNDGVFDYSDYDCSADPAQAPSGGPIVRSEIKVESSGNVTFWSRNGGWSDGPFTRLYTYDGDNVTSYKQYATFDANLDSPSSGGDLPQKWYTYSYVGNGLTGAIEKNPANGDNRYEEKFEINNCGKFVPVELNIPDDHKIFKYAWAERNTKNSGLCAVTGTTVTTDEHFGKRYPVASNAGNPADGKVTEETCELTNGCYVTEIDNFVTKYTITRTFLEEIDLRDALEAIQRT